MYWPPLATLFFLASACKIAVALNIEGRVLWNDACSGYGDLGHAKVILDGGRLSAGIQRDGSFSVPDVDEGSFILSVVSHDYAFDDVRIDVHSSGEAHPDVWPYIPGTPHNPPSSVRLKYPVVLTPRQRAIYFVERQSFNALGMLQSPMVLMMIATGILLIAMPYIMKNLDPETAKEVSERQARYAHLQNAVQRGDIRKGFSALLTKESNPEPASGQTISRKTASTPTPTKPKGNISKGGRRR